MLLRLSLAVATLAAMAALQPTEIAHCASCPEWKCVTDTSCGGSVPGCTCLKTGHELLGICVSVGR